MRVLANWWISVCQNYSLRISREPDQLTQSGPLGNEGFRKVLVVIPTYNEAENISALLSSIFEFCPDIDALVVDDSSPDGTAEVVAAWSRQFGPRVQLLNRPEKQGLAAAYRNGFEMALGRGYEIVVQMDADGSHPPAIIPRLIKAIEDGADLVLGSRYVRGGAVAADWGWYRHALSRFGNLYARILLKVSYKDLTGGFKAWSAPLLRELWPLGGDLSGYGFQIHTTIQAHRVGARIVEIPFVFRDRLHGYSKMSTVIALEGFWAVLRMRTSTRLPARWVSERDLGSGLRCPDPLRGPR